MDVVLVHGTTQSAAGFAGVMDALRGNGHRVVAVEVPGGEANTAADYAELLAPQVPEEFARPVVAAHSAAGLLLPALAQRIAAGHQVWLAAAVADYPGERSLLDEVLLDPLAVFNSEWVGVDPTSDPVLATYFLFHDADLATLRAGLATVAACDLSDVYAQTPTHDPARLPSTYVLPSGDRTLRVAWMRRVARQRLGVEPVEIAGGHNFYVASPAATARLIESAEPGGLAGRSRQ